MYRPIEEEDVKFLWASYKKGGLIDLGLPDDLSPADFSEQFRALVHHNFHAVWVVYGETKKGFLPIAYVFAVWLPHWPILSCTGAIYMPWASHRNIIEAAVYFTNEVRKEVSMVGYALPEHKRLYEICAMHGAIRRVGTSHNLVPGKPVAIFETRNLSK